MAQHPVQELPTARTASASCAAASSCWSRANRQELSDKPIKAAGADVDRLRRAHADAGLIDCHVHVIHSEVNIRFMEAMPLT